MIFYFMKLSCVDYAIIQLKSGVYLFEVKKAARLMQPCWNHFELEINPKSLILKPEELLT